MASFFSFCIFAKAAPFSCFTLFASFFFSFCSSREFLILDVGVGGLFLEILKEGLLGTTGLPDFLGDAAGFGFLCGKLRDGRTGVLGGLFTGGLGRRLIDFEMVLTDFFVFGTSSCDGGLGTIVFSNEVGIDGGEGSFRFAAIAGVPSSSGEEISSTSAFVKGDIIRFDRRLKISGSGREAMPGRGVPVA